MRFEERKIAKDGLYSAKRPIKLWIGDADSIVVPKLAKRITSSKYMIWIFRWSYKTISFGDA